MPILSQDVKLYKSDTLTDEDSGGGAITADVVTGDQSNELMKDISTLDRTYGRMMMRKAFAQVHTQDTDTYLGAHTIISKIPSDPSIGVTLFSTGDHYDRRDEAATRVENYRAKGAKYTGYLWATQWKGGKVVTIFQNLDVPLVAIGEVLYLSQASESEVQYIKVTKLNSREQTFTINGNSFQKRILELEITQPLEYDFIGVEMHNDDSTISPTDIKKTVVANAAKYYSSRYLEEDTVIGSTNLRVDTVFSSVVPSSVSEVAILNANANGEDQGLVPREDGTVQNTGYFTLSPNGVYYLGMTATAGTIDIKVGGITLTDGGGNLYLGTDVVGSVDYTSGFFTMLSTAPSMSGSGHIQFTPAVESPVVMDSDMLEVTDANRGLVWVYSFTRKPKVGSVRVSYRSFGEWYDLIDNSSGGLLGQEDGIGTGQVNYDNKSLSVSLAALPDEGSAIMITWGYQNDVILHNPAPELPYFEFTLANEGVDISSVNISWSQGGANKVATIASNRQVVGDATGELLVGSTLKITPNTVVPKGTSFTVTYNYGTPTTTTNAGLIPDGAGNIVFDLEDNILAGSLRMQWAVDPLVDPLGATHPVWRRYAGTPTALTVVDYDDALGGFENHTGTIDYNSGAVSLNPATYVASIPVRRKVTRSWGTYYVYYLEDYTATIPVSGGEVVCTYLVQGNSSGSATEVFSGVEYKLNTHIQGLYIAGTANFEFQGTVYVGKAFELHTDVNYTTGFGTIAGSVTPAGEVVIDSWADGSPVEEIQVRLAYTVDGDSYTSRIAFRVPNAPVKTESLSITYTIAEGTQHTVVSNPQGAFIDATIQSGKILYDAGVVLIDFTTPIDVATFKYHAVVQKFLPLDQNILKLNPVRLPQDGRVIVYSVGDVVAIIHDNVQELTPAQNDVTTLRPRVSKVTILDAAQQLVDITKYTVDLDAGTITWGDMTGVSTPLQVSDRIEDLRVLTDVQITGRLEVNMPLTHVFPANEAMVCSAVVHSDVFANVGEPFDQQTWTGVWQDSRIGSDTLGVLNTSQYPIVVNNASCIEERWLIKFRSATHVDVIGEQMGQVLTNVPISGTIAPQNPNTLEPWWSLNPLALGAGWASGNSIRFNTYAATVPLWILKAISPTNDPSDEDDALRFCVEMRGNVDAP